MDLKIYLTTLKTTWIEIANCFNSIFTATNIQIPLLTRLMDTIGKLFGFLLIIYLLSEEQYRLVGISIYFNKCIINPRKR